MQRQTHHLAAGRHYFLREQYSPSNL
jgi:hypothetical protein